MASGKTAVGREVADALGLELVDVDDSIQVRTGRSVKQLWEEGGEAAYRPLERQVVVEALAPGPGRVLAAPGGVAIDPVAGDALAQPHVTVVYLRARPETLADRVREDDQPRPLLGDDPEGVLGDMFDQRDGWYLANAQLVEEADERTPGEIAQHVLDALVRLRPKGR
jgi:shikimate kinase